MDDTLSRCQTTIADLRAKLESANTMRDEIGHYLMVPYGYTNPAIWERLHKAVADFDAPRLIADHPLSESDEGVTRIAPKTRIDAASLCIYLQGRQIEALEVRLDEQAELISELQAAPTFWTITKQLAKRIAALEAMKEIAS